MGDGKGQSTKGRMAMLAEENAAAQEQGPVSEMAYYRSWNGMKRGDRGFDKGEREP